jgi:hypothetical protein
MRFLRPAPAKLPHVRDREHRNRYLGVALVAAAAAAVVWFVFRGVYENLSISESAVGYVDPLTQGGIYLGYVVMLGGAIALAAIAIWAAIVYLRLTLRR